MMKMRAALLATVFVALSACGANRTPAEERLLSLIPANVRETCVTERRDMFGDITHAAALGRHGAVAGFFCKLERELGLMDDVALTYLLYETRNSMDADYLALAWQSANGSSCLNDSVVESFWERDGQQAGRVYCERDWYGNPQPHIVWADQKALVLADAYGTFGSDPPLLVRAWEQLTQGRVLSAGIGF